jgi:transposase-like protein
MGHNSSLRWHLKFGEGIIQKLKSNPLMSTPCPRTLAMFSNFCLNTQKSINIKVVQKFMGHNSSLRWHLKFGEGIVQKLKSNLI